MCLLGLPKLYKNLVCHYRLPLCEVKYLAFTSEVPFAELDVKPVVYELN